MAVTVVTQAAAAITASRSPSVTFSGYVPQTGDVVALWAWCNVSFALTGGADPSGWTNVLGTNQVFNLADTSMGAACYCREVTAGEVSGGTTTYTLTNLYSSNKTGETMGAVLRGVDLTAIVDSFGQTSQETVGTSHSLAGLTGADLSTGSKVLSGICADGTGTAYDVSPTGYTSLTTTSGTNATGRLYEASSTTTSGVDVSAVSVTGPGDEYACITVAFTALAGGTTLTVDAVDAVGITDSAVVALDQTIVDSDAVGITDSAVIALDQTIPDTDVIGITDDATVTLDVFIDGPADTIGITDSVTIVLASQVTDTDAIGITDSATIALDQTITDTDTIGIIDSVVITLGAQVSDTDTIGITDSAIISIHHHITVVDTIGLTDSVNIVLASAGPADICFDVGSPTFVSQAPGAPVFTPQTAGSPTLLDRDAGTPTFVSRSATLVLGHGQLDNTLACEE